MYALEDAGIRRVFEDHEFEDLLLRVKTELVPRLDDVRRKWQSNRDYDLPPDDHMQPLLDSFGTLKKLLSDDEDAVKIVDRETARVIEWIAEQMPEDPDTRQSRRLGEVQALDELHGDRSIFEDVDA